MKRRLAAVLAADICDYSRLMGEDADAMLRILRRLRAEVFGPAVASKRGRIVKSSGDGWIVLFSSAGDAVGAAIAVQDGLSQSARPDEPLVQMRIGVHLGDVVEEDQDVFGDSINIAARLEAATAPGTVAISEAVFGSIDGTLRPSFDAVGTWELKNITWPVHIWVRAAPVVTSGADASDRLKLVIRPVETSDTRSEMRELADAITGDLSGYLNVTAWLQAVTNTEAGGAEYVLENRLRGRGDRVRLEARLVDANGSVLFSDKFDGDLTEAFDWQDMVGEDLAGKTIQTVYDTERGKLMPRDVADLTAEECVLRSQLEAHYLDPAGMQRGLDIARTALTKNPKSPDAMTQFLVMLGMQEEIPADCLGEFEHWVTAAEPFFADHPLLEFMATGLRNARLRDDTAEYQFRHDIVESCLRRAPRDFLILVWVGWVYLFLGEPEKAMGCLRKSWALGRHTPWSTSIENGIAMVYLQQGRFTQAIEQAQAVLAVAPEYPPPQRMLVAALAQAGRIEEARQALDRLLERDPDASIRKLQGHTPYVDTPETRRYLDGLRTAGMPE